MGRFIRRKKPNSVMNVILRHTLNIYKSSRTNSGQTLIACHRSQIIRFSFFASGTAFVGPDAPSPEPPTKPLIFPSSSSIHFIRWAPFQRQLITATARRSLTCTYTEAEGNICTWSRVSDKRGGTVFQSSPQALFCDTSGEKKKPQKAWTISFVAASFEV